MSIPRSCSFFLGGVSGLGLVVAVPYLASVLLDKGT
jgi:hypothetical protein